AVVGGVLLGVDLILADDAEGDFAVSGDGVDLVAGGGAVEVDDAVLVDVAEGDGIGIAVVPGYGENAGGVLLENLFTRFSGKGLAAPSHFSKHSYTSIRV